MHYNNYAAKAVAQLRSERGGVPPRHRRRVLHQLLRQEGRPAGRRALLQLPQLHRLDERGGSRVLPVRRRDAAPVTSRSWASRATTTSCVDATDSSSDKPRSSPPATRRGAPSDDAVAAMAEVGLKIGRGLLRDAPPWLAHFVGHVARFMRRELARLPRDILAEHRATTAKEVKKANGKWIPPPSASATRRSRRSACAKTDCRAWPSASVRCATSSGAGPSARRSPTRRRP